MTIDVVQNLGSTIQYIATAGQTVFPVPFPFVSNTDIVVQAGTLALVNGTDYNVSGAGNDTGGNVTLTVGAVVNTVYTITRNIAIQRLTEYQQNGPFTSAAINAELDNIVLIEQQLSDRLGRAIRIPVTSTAPSTGLELNPASFAGAVLTMDINGNILPGVFATTPITQAVINALINGQTVAETTAGVTPANQAVPPHTQIGVFIVDRYGTNAVPGTTDMTTAINHAIAVATAAGGGVVQMLSGVYKTTANIAVPAYVTLQGVGRGNGAGTGGTRVAPAAGIYNPVSVHGASFASYLVGASVRNFEIDGSAGCVGTGLDIKYAGLRCLFADMYIHNMTGIGMRTEGCFDHVYERIECRANTSFNIENFEKQAGPDGVYEESSYLRFIDCVAVAGNSGTMLTFPSTTGTGYVKGETVTQATSGATGVVNSFDQDPNFLYLKSVTGTFDTTHVVTGGTSGVTGTPSATTGAAQNLTQWNVAGGDNHYFVSVKPTEGLVGMMFSRSSFNHKIGQLFFDSTNSGTGTAVQIASPGFGTVTFLDIEKVNCFQGAVGVQVNGGANINVGTIDMSIGANPPVATASGVAGPVNLLVPNTSYIDSGATPVTYPYEQAGTFTPTLTNVTLGTGGTAVGAYRQKGKEVFFSILITLGTGGSLTGAPGISIPTATKIAAASGKSYQFTGLANHQGGSALAVIGVQLTTVTMVSFTVAGAFLSGTVPFTWQSGDTYSVNGTYEVN